MRPAGFPPVGEYAGFVSFASPTIVQPSSSASKPLVGIATTGGGVSGSEPHATIASPASARPHTNTLAIETSVVRLGGRRRYRRDSQRHPFGWLLNRAGSRVMHPSD